MKDTYRPVSSDAHVRATEEALRHWDKRRADDRQSEVLQPHNICAVTSRQQGLMRAIYFMESRGLDMSKAQVLDVGCAQGYGLRPFLLDGFAMEQLHGIDLMADRVERGKYLTPSMDLIQGDATAMPYEAQSFDIVCEQFCFCHVPVDEAKIKIAAEMMRVSRQFILIHDWRMGSKSKQLYGVTQAKIRTWFPGWHVVDRFRSQLWPPLGRPFSRFAWPLYDLARAFSPLVGSWFTVLHR